MSRTRTEPKSAPAIPAESPERLPLKAWSLELARRWNGGTYSLFVLHGNVFDLYPVLENGVLDYVSLKVFLLRRFFLPARLRSLLRHQRRPDLRNRRNAEAVFRVAGNL